MDTDTAARIVESVAPWVTVVAVFADQPSDEIYSTLEHVSVDQIQFHGDESPEFCQSFGRPWLKGVRMRPNLDLESYLPAFSGARGILVDTYKSGVIGGTGSAFDWSRLEGVDKRKLILAGGLNPNNVGDALELVRPAAIDVSTGVESGAGQKSRDLIFQFMAAVHDHDLGSRRT